MDKLFYIVLGISAGLLVPFQAIINSKLSTTIKNPIQTGLISFTGGFLVFILLIVLGPVKFPPLSILTTVNPVLLTGGIIGSGFVFAAIFAVPKIGSTAWVSLIIAGQLITSLVLDHYGILGLPVKAINIYRALGSVLLFSGTYLIVKF